MDINNTPGPEDAIEPKMRFTGKIVKTSLAGAVVDIGQKIPGVIHISQLQKEPVNRVEDIVKPGDSVEVWVRRVLKDSIEVTMIEPLALEWREMKPEMIVKGKVERMESYGAFVDIGAERPGLVHVSEITHGYLKNPNEVLKEGDEVEAMIMEVNRRKKQIRLSIKAVTPKPEEILREVEKETRKSRGKKGRSKEEIDIEESKPAEPEPTSMELAFRAAQERAKQRDNAKDRKVKMAVSQEQEDILNRTLENRMPTG
jgi:ribosomal protein S1